jgi:uncharacterized NAD(P)/FAD-binding protein YdhS
MTDIEAAQGQLRLLAQRLGEIQTDLRRVSASLPPGGDPEEQDAAVEIRAVIDCVLVDSIRPAIRDLRAAAEYSGQAEDEAPEPGGSMNGKP